MKLLSIIVLKAVNYSKCMTGLRVIQLNPVNTDTVGAIESTRIIRGSFLKFKSTP